MRPAIRLEGKSCWTQYMKDSNIFVGGAAYNFLRREVLQDTIDLSIKACNIENNEQVFSCGLVKAKLSLYQVDALGLDKVYGVSFTKW